MVRVGRDIFTSGSTASGTVHRGVDTREALFLGIVSKPKDKGAAFLAALVGELGSRVGVNRVSMSVRADLSTREITSLAKMRSVRVRGYKLYRVSTSVMSHTLLRCSARGLSLLVLRGVKGLIYPTRFSANTRGGIVLLDIPRKSSGPLGCPLVFRMDSLMLVGGVSALRCFSFSFRITGRQVLGLGPGTIILPIDTGAKRKVREIVS